MSQQARRSPAKNQKPNKQAAARVASFAEHIRELRSRLLWVALLLVVASSVAYNYHGWLTDVVLAPIHHQKLIYLTPTGGFNFIFQITMYAGFIVTIPMLVYQLYGFVKPALPSHSRKAAVKIILASILLLMAGVGFGYFVAVPSSLAFLTDFAADAITPNLTADSYLSFIAAYMLGLGVLFQLPLLLLLWNWISPLSPGGLLKSERYVILFSFVAAAIITPTPDIMNQAMIALPIVGIYQLGVVAVFISSRRKKKQQAKAAKQAVIRPIASPIVVPVPKQQQPVASPSPVLQPIHSPKTVSEIVPPKRPLLRPAQPLRVVSRQPPVLLKPQRGMSIDGIISR